MDNFNLESKEGMQEPIGMLREGVGGGGGVAGGQVLLMAFS